MRHAVLKGAGRNISVSRLAAWIYLEPPLGGFDLFDPDVRVIHLPRRCRTPACFRYDHLEVVAARKIR
jgi:hypothetical protein